jgi:DNA end-binding protein Ku
MPRPVWSGVITFGMVSIPVDLFSAIQEKDVHFHQLHKPCGSRVKLQKYCPVHKEVVPDDEIVKGYEISKGKYVVMEDSDFESLPVPAQHTVTVTAFVKAEEVDPILFDHSYFARPEDSARKPYALLVHAMRDQKVSALAQIALRSKESLCLVRPSGDSLVLETLFYPDEVRDEGKADMSDMVVDAKELKMAASLIELLEQPFEPKNYHDEYREALLNRIEEKSKGHQVEAPAAAEPPPGKVIDLMEALRQSVEAAKSKRKTG